MMNTHRKLALISILSSIILVACGPSGADLSGTATQSSAVNLATLSAKAPAATSTSTPEPSATSTPKPTQTPAPTPTATPAPTKNPLAGEFVDGKLVMTDSTYRQLTETGQKMFAEGYYLYEAFLYDAMLEFSLKPEQLINLYNLQHEDYEYLGHYDQANENLLQILDLGDRRAGFLNGLCWNYAITNQPEQALPYCEEAVTKDPSAMALDSRAVTYALLGKYPEAVSDFEAALAQGGFPSEDMQAQRHEWVTMLKAGQNPITEQVLAQERGEEVNLAPDPWFTGNLSISYLRAQYENSGYVFEKTVIDGQPALTSTLQDGTCKVAIVLCGDDQEFKGGTSTISGCTHSDLNSHAVDFILPFSRDLKEMARAIVWNAADLYYVIEGKPVTDLSPTFGNFQFSMERTNVPGEEVIIINASPSD